MEEIYTKPDNMFYWICNETGNEFGPYFQSDHAVQDMMQYKNTILPQILLDQQENNS